MRIIAEISEMQQQSRSWRNEGKRIGLVPTMGYLHEGHLSLMRAIRSHADVVVMSIFVNPVQFGPGEDFERYPRDLDRDLNLATEAGVDMCFLPTAGEMYPPGFQTYVEVTTVTRSLCGASRPGHFRGVTTVVSKLFNIIKPDVAMFGEKDFQQLVTIRRMVRDLDLGIEVLGHPIVREPDGLALSSRNVYLDQPRREVALRLSRALSVARGLVSSGVDHAKTILASVRETLDQGESLRVDYAELRDPETLEPVEILKGPTLLALAATVGTTRLIDNCVLHLPL